jgi:cardiolipin synthase
MNITDKYINPNNNNLFWRDTHVMIKGEAVFDLQLLFISDWFFVSGKKIEPNQNVDFSSIDCQVPTSILGSDYGTDFQHIMEAFFGMITNAKEEVLISTPYFLPNETILNALIITAKSGVKIKLLLPQKTDLASAYYASQTYLKEVLKNNIEVYYYTKGMMHAKTMIVDNSICTVGSTNMDQRSFDLNAEVNMFIIDEKKSLELKSQFEADLKDSYKLNINELLNWPWYKKALSSLARLIAPIL